MLHCLYGRSEKRTQLLSVHTFSFFTNHTTTQQLVVHVCLFMRDHSLAGPDQPLSLCCVTLGFQWCTNDFWTMLGKSSHTHTQTDSLSGGVVNKQQAHSCCCKCHVLWLWDRRVVSSGFTSSHSNFSSFIQTHHWKLKVLAFKRIPFFFSCRCYCG